MDKIAQLKSQRDATSKALQYTLGVIADLAKDNRRLLAELDEAKDRIEELEQRKCSCLWEVGDDPECLMHENSIKPGPEKGQQEDAG